MSQIYCAAVEPPEKYVLSPTPDENKGGAQFKS